MKRDFSRLKEGPFDLLVIGGGIYGAWTAYDGALRGLRVALVEKGDWGCGTSSASSKLIHGGLRYLEHFWFEVVARSLKERSLLLSLAPHRVTPLPFIFPLYEGGRMGRWSLKAGLTLYDFLGVHNFSPRHRYLAREDLLEEAPLLDSRGLRGGYLYSDAQTDDARFTLEIVAGALKAGAEAVNYASLERLLVAGDRVQGGLIRDGESGETIELRAAVTVNAAGPWSWGLEGFKGKGMGEARFTKGVHLIMPPLPGKEALLLTAPSDGRVFFLIPWYGSTMIGTTDTDFRGTPEEVDVEEGDIDYLLSSANHYLGENRWHRSQVRGSFAGLRSLMATPGKTPSSLTRKWVLSQPMEHFYTTIGGKFTSARVEGVETINRVLALLGKKAGPSPTAALPFPWCPDRRNDWKKEGEEEGLRRGLSRESAQLLTHRYGSRLSALLAPLKSDPTLASPIIPGLPFIEAEVVHAAKEEMARNLKDILRRRLPLLLLGRPEEETLRRCAHRAGEVLHWTEERREKEVSHLILETSGS